MMKTQEKSEKKLLFSPEGISASHGGLCLIYETHPSILSDHVLKAENYDQVLLIYEKNNIPFLNDIFHVN